MKRAVGILAIALAPMFGASAIAADYGAGSGSSERGTMSGAASGAASAAQGYMGQHTMSGRITEIDKTAGTVSIQAEGGKDMELHFPPSALQNLNEGDQVSVQLAIKPGTAGRGTTSGTGGRTGGGTGTEGGAGSGTRGGGMPESGGGMR